ncbi:MAG: hypothetical protein HZA60_04695 [Deltaproteobacteria bacterium]|nr:hypothetical protein [Deltaproteobacteria bacterium]
MRSSLLAAIGTAGLLFAICAQSAYSIFRKTATAAGSKWDPLSFAMDSAASR